MEEKIETLKIDFPHLFITFQIDNNLTFENESDIGFIEYKRTLVDCCDIKLQKYATQMRWRITQNSKQIATYFIGLDDDGTIIGLTIDDIRASVHNLIKIADIIGASIINIHMLEIDEKSILKVKVKIKKKLINEYLEFLIN